MNVSSSSLSFYVGKVKFAIITPPSSMTPGRKAEDLTIVYIIIINVVVGSALVALIVIFCWYRRKNKQRLQSESTSAGIQMDSLESRILLERRQG